MMEKWAAVVLLVERMTRFGGGAAENDGLVMPVMVPLVVPTLFRFPDHRAEPLELTWAETRALTVAMAKAVSGAWPDNASRNYWLTAIMPHSDAPPAGARPAWAAEFTLGDRFPEAAGSA